MSAHTLSQRYRMVASKGLLLLILLILVFTHHSWGQDSVTDLFMEVTGMVFIVACTFGRLWASLYACGYKDETIIRQGPYSVMRNPLYFFSFLGTIGIGLASENLLVLGLGVVAFLLYYPFVIRSEEAYLSNKFGDEYRTYMRSTPRYLPDFRQLAEPEFHQVNVRAYKRALSDATMFVWLYLLMLIVEKLHYMKVLPVVLHIP